MNARAAEAARDGSSPARWVLQLQGSDVPQWSLIGAWPKAIGLKHGVSGRYTARLRFDREPAMLLRSWPDMGSGFGFDADLQVSRGKWLRQYAGVGPAVTIQRGKNL